MGSSFKDLKSLKNLSLNFWYFLQYILNQFQDAFAHSFMPAQERLWIWVLNFFSLFLFYAAEPLFLYSNILKNRFTKVSDHGCAALGSSITDMKILTNLSLNFWYFFKEYFGQCQTHLRAVCLAAQEMLCFRVKHDISTLLACHILLSWACFFDSDFFKIAGVMIQIMSLMLWDPPLKTWRIWQICR